MFVTPSFETDGLGKGKSSGISKGEKSQINFPDVMTQLWYCTIEGIPTKLKNTRRMDLDSARETWRELITNGWESIEHQINEDAA